MLLRAVHHALRDVLVYCTLLHVLRVKVCDLRAQLLWFASTSFLALANGLSMTSIVLRVLCFGVRDVSLRSSSSSAATAAFGDVPQGQWALLGTDTLVLIDQSACLVDRRTCDRRIKCVPHGPLTVSFVISIVGSLRRVVLAPSSHSL